MKSPERVWKLLRHLVGLTLFVEGPRSAADMEDRARRHDYPLRTLFAVAQSLGVEVFMQDGEKYWRLPDNVVPLIQRDCQYAPMRDCLAPFGAASDTPTSHQH
jgi:hypothetical protein